LGVEPAFNLREDGGVHWGKGNGLPPPRKQEPVNKVQYLLSATGREQQCVEKPGTGHEIK